jgi:hypothetical protein
MTNNFTIGDRVKLIALPPYLKTADPMPMLRPANILAIADEGVIIDRRPGGYWGIRFAQGAFLLESKYLEFISS